MRQHRTHPRNLTLAVALLALPALACGPTIFADTNALTVVGEPPAPPPPPPEPEPEPEPPPPRRVQVTAAAIVITEKILFEVDKAVIQPESFDLMNEITTVVKDNPRIRKISIEGHTDGDGSAKHNKKLSQKRADSVMTYLVEHGVEPERLVAVGFGEDKPMDSNETDEGKEKNRRVEFLIVEQGEQTDVVEIDPATGEKKVIESTVETPVPTPEGVEGGVAGGVPGGTTVAAPSKKSDGGAP